MSVSVASAFVATVAALFFGAAILGVSWDATQGINDIISAKITEASR